jgi:hypothetical protein
MNDPVSNLWGDPFWTVFSLSSVVHIATFLWVLQHLTRTRRDPIAAMLWIMVTWTLPFIGFFIYLSFGINRVAAKPGGRSRPTRSFTRNGPFENRMSFR